MPAYELFKEAEVRNSDSLLGSPSNMASIKSKYAGIPSLTVAGSDWFRMELARLSAKLLVVELIIQEHPGSQTRKMTRRMTKDNLCAVPDALSGHCRVLKLCKPTNPVDYKWVETAV
jgi:hypothetical protein